MKPEILPEERVSRRRLTPLRRLLYALLAPVALGVLRALVGQLPHRAGGGRRASRRGARGRRRRCCRATGTSTSCSAARWLLLQIRRGLKLGFLISPSVDGEMPRGSPARLGAAVIRGSSTRTGARALRDYYQLLVKDGYRP